MFKRLSFLIFIATLSLMQGCATQQAIPAGAVTIYEKKSELPDDKHIIVKSILQDDVLLPFSGSDRLKGKLEAIAYNKNYKNILITKIWEQKVTDRAIGAMYLFGQAYAIELVDPTKELIIKTIKYPNVKDLEFESAINHAKSISSTDLSNAAKSYLEKRKNGQYSTFSGSRSLMPYLKIIDRIDGSKSKSFYLSMVKESGSYPHVFMDYYTKYATGKDAEELVKLLKYHSSPDVRIKAGEKLIGVKQISNVEKAAIVDENQRVREKLKAALLDI